jgi:hypothetical protein
MGKQKQIKMNWSIVGELGHGVVTGLELRFNDCDY